MSCCATCSWLVPAFVHMALPILTLPNVCVWHQNSSCNTMCCFPSVEVGILAAPRAKGWSVVDIPHGLGVRVANLCHCGYCQSWSYADLLCPISHALQGAVGASRGWIQACQSAPEQLSHPWFLPANVQKLDFISTYQELVSAHFLQKPAAHWAEHSGKANWSRAVAQKASCEWSV